MAKRNECLSIIPKLYERQAFHLMLYTFMDTYKFLFPSVSLQEAAIAFQRRYTLFECSDTDDVIRTYHRVNADLIEASKS